jgi:hypothetical protein
MGLYRRSFYLLADNTRFRTDIYPNGCIAGVDSRFGAGVSGPD